MPRTPAKLPAPPNTPPQQLTTVLSHSARPDSWSPSRSLLRASYAELHQLAETLMRPRQGSRSIDPCTLVNEAARHSLGASGLQELDDRGAYLAYLANALWRILNDQVEATALQKGDTPGVWLSLQGESGSMPVEKLVTRLKHLNDRSPRHAQAAVLRAFGGLSNNEIAEQLHIPPGRAAIIWEQARQHLAASVP